MVFTSTGILRYSSDKLGFRLVAEASPGIAAFYRALVPKSLSIQKPRWPAHCTVVRIGKEEPKDFTAWGRYEGEIVTFNYDPYVHVDEMYYWLNVWCDRFVEIRTELGMRPKSRWTLPPSGSHQCFHMTIGNKKF